MTPDLATPTPSLAALSVLEEGRVLGFASQLREDFQKRLRELGFREGALVRCLRRTPFGGPRIFEVGGAVFSIEAEVARHIVLVQHKLQ